MPEEPGGGAESLLISFPNAVRLRQQLGYVSINQRHKNKLVSSIEQFGGREIPVDDFLESLEEKLTYFAETYLHGITSLALESMPVIIDSVVTEEPQRTKALELWAERVEVKRGEAERVEKIKRRLTSPKPEKIPRKRKKAEKRRGIIQIDPSRLSSNPNYGKKRR
ncbi:MAG TPA: hypothetical protein VHB72_04780 [Candidatus Saccharimonadales bacterium]|nr:hypothetical protein [Candidatus Saccharimonadales bacterium]